MAITYGQQHEKTTDDIENTVGGNRYAWFSHVDALNGIDIDNHQLFLGEEAPEAPTNLTLVDSGGNNIANGAWTNSYSVTASWDEVDGVSSYEYSYWNNIETSPYFTEANRWIVDNGASLSRSGVFNQGEGTHYIAVRAVSSSGIESEWSEILTVRYDETAPNVSNVMLNDVEVNNTHIRTENCEDIQQAYAVSGQFEFSAVIEDELSGVDRAWYRVRAVNENGCSRSDLFNSSRISLQYDEELDTWETPEAFDVSELDDGLYTITLIKRDNAGNQTNSFVDLLVDNTKPTHTIDSHISGDVVEGTFLLEGTASDGWSGVDEVTVQINKITEVGGSFVRVEQLRQPVSYNPTTQAWMFSVSTEALEDGVYRFNINSVDEAGNVRFAPNIDLVVVNSTITDLVNDTPELSILLAAVQAAELGEILADESAEFTVFAPVDSAFAQLLSDLGIDAVDLLASPDLAGILTYHVVPGVFESGDLTDGQILTTLEGTDLTVEIEEDGKVFIVDEADNRAEVVTADVRATNGVVHLIDAVLQFAPVTELPLVDATPDAENPEDPDGLGGENEVAQPDQEPTPGQQILGVATEEQQPIIFTQADSGLTNNEEQEEGDELPNGQGDQGVISQSASTTAQQEDGEVLAAADDIDEGGSMTWVWILLAVLGLGSLFLLFARRQADEE